MEATLYGRTVHVGWPQGILIGLVVLGTVAVVTAGVTATAPFATYNADWTGTSDLRQLAESDDRAVIVAPDGSLPNEAVTNETVMLVVGTPANATATQQTAQQVITQGGTVVVADDVATPSNDLLRAVGASARIRNGPLRDPRSYHQGPSLPIAEPTTDGQAQNISAFTLNHAGFVEPNGAAVLARSSEFAYVDRNRNDQFDQRESFGRRPVMTTESVGDGEVVVVSDSSVFVNAMLEREGNTAVAKALITDADTVILTSATPRPLPPVANALLIARRAPLVQVLLLMTLIGGVLALSRVTTRRRDTRKEGTPAADPQTATVSSPTTADRTNATEGFIEVVAGDLTDRAQDQERLRRVVRAAVTNGSMDDGQLTTEDRDDE